MIREGLTGKKILITGATGFLGKTLLEKLLRDVPELDRVCLAIRGRGRRGSEDRLHREVLASPCFQGLRKKLGEEQFEELVENKIQVLAADLGQEDLGLSDQDRSVLQSCDIVIHSAAAVEFDNPADLSAETNLLGAARLTRELARSPKRPHLVHISTAYVGGMLRGLVRETTLLDPGLNWRTEAAVLTGLRPTVEAESRQAEVLRQLRSDALSRIGPAGGPAVARWVERLRQRWVKDQLVEQGRVHARAMGFSDIYSFTKALAEQAVRELHGELPLSIVRPTIIESALKDPFPGWLEGFRMAEPLILAFGRGGLEDFPAHADAVLDIIPVDYVVNALLAVAATPPPPAEPAVYHVASGSRNPLRFRQLVSEGGAYFAAHPLRDRFGQPIATKDWTYPDRGEVMARGRSVLRLLEVGQSALELLPLGARTTPLIDRMSESRDRLERSLELVELYGVYTQTDCIFDTAHLMGLYERLPQADRAAFPFDAANFDWRHYLQDVHFPTVVRMARAQTSPRPQPSGETRPAEESRSALQVIERRTGRSDIVAVFDVDGTLLDTNVVEYLLWMRLRAEPVTRWPAVALGLLQSVPRWLYLERRSRADFQRTFYREYEGLDVEEIRRLGREAFEAVTLRRVYPEGMRRVRAHQAAGHRVFLLTGALSFVVEPLAEMLGCDLDCAQLQVEGSQFTGDLVEPPPAGEARASVLETYATQHEVVLWESFGYADSISDLPLLEAVGTPVAVNPDARLSALARQRGWRSEKWATTPGNWSLPVPDPWREVKREALRR